MDRSATGVVVSADGAVKSAQGLVHAVILAAGAGAAATLELNDSGDGSGDDLVALVALQGTTVPISFPRPVLFGTGIYADIGGAGAAATVVYE